MSRHNQKSLLPTATIKGTTTAFLLTFTRLVFLAWSGDPELSIPDPVRGVGAADELLD